MDFDYGLLAEMEESTAGSTLNYVNYGETWIDNIMLVSWNNTDKVYEKVEYSGEPFNPSKSHIEFQLHQTVTKKDGDEFTKTWYVDKRKSGNRAKDRKDWHEIIRPSVEKVFGSEAAFFKAMGKHARCAIEDFVTGKVNAKGYDVTAPRFLATFKTKAEEDADRNNRFANKNGSIPDEVPADVLGGVKGILKVKGITQEQIMDAIASEYPDYDANKLYELAKG